jgi:hypothetical protein
LALKRSRRNQKTNPPYPPTRICEKIPCQFRKAKKKKKKKTLVHWHKKTDVFPFSSRNRKSPSKVISKLIPFNKRPTSL